MVAIKVWCNCCFGCCVPWFPPYLQCRGTLEGGLFGDATYGFNGGVVAGGVGISACASIGALMGRFPVWYDRAV